ncbi:MAG: hypothetical protein GX245_01360 [Eubacteriaceae bacterium]|nr:hypothetical protein [Eubacteriaceae bacterium]
MYTREALNLQSQNLYGYKGNTPVNYVDSVGHNPVLLLLARLWTQYGQPF